MIMYLTASDEKNCTTVNKERNSSKLTTQVILVLYQSKKRELLQIIGKVHFEVLIFKSFLEKLLTILSGVL